MNKGNEELKKIYNLSISKWGLTAQLNMLVEECSELINEICNFLGGAKNKDKIAEEIADVEIMIQQIKYFLRLDNEVEKQKSIKINRLWDIVRK